ncbi:MAG: biotin/lipoyl-binding protein [Pseudomonadota bacterium]
MPVKVKRERPDQRRHHRVTAPLFVDVEGWRLRAEDWSLGGLQVVGFPDTVPALGQEIDLQLTLPFQGFDVTFDASGKVVRSEQDTGTIAVRFTEVGDRELELMSHFLEELVRGSMVSIDDTINRIDVPVTPASLNPSSDVAADVPIRRWPIKTIVVSTVYTLLGLAVLGYTALLIYTNFYKLEVQTAVISAPVAPVKAVAEGRLTSLAAEPGKTVREGQVLARIENPALEREINLAELGIRTQKAKVAYLKQRHADELKRAESFATLELKNVKTAKLRLESLQAQLATAKLHLDRISALYKKGYTTDAKREAAEREVIRLKKLADEQELDLQSRSKLAKNNLGERFYTGDNVVGDLGDIEARMRLAEHELKISTQRHHALLKHRDRIRLEAPFGGRVTEVLRRKNTFVKKGETVARIERPDQRHVLAYLTQDEVLGVGLNDPVDLVIPAASRSLTGTVVQIDRTDGFRREQERAQPPGYSWRGPTDRSAIVVISFSDPAAANADPALIPGTPVIAIFPRRAGQAAMRTVQRKLLSVQ